MSDTKEAEKIQEGEQLPETQNEKTPDQPEAVKQDSTPEQPKVDMTLNSMKDLPDVDKTEKATVFQAQINLFKGLIGLGVIALPVGFSQAGWVAGVVLIPIVGYAMFYCACLMLNIANDRGLNPQNIVEFTVMMFERDGVVGSGKTAGHIVTFFLFCLQLGVCIGYTIFFMNYFQVSFCYYGWELGCSDRIYAVLFALAIVLPLGLIRNINNLKIPSNIGNIILIISLVVMMFACYDEIQTNGPKLEKAFDFWGLSSYVGIVVFTLEGVGLFFDIRYSMKEPKEFKPALLNVVHVAIILYVTIGFVGYMAFGSQVEDLLLFNLPMDNDIYFSVQILYSLVLCLSFPLQLFPVANYIEQQMRESMFIKPSLANDHPEDQRNDSLYISQHNISYISQRPMTNPDDEATLTKYSLSMRVVLTLGIFCIAMTLTKVSVFLNLAGSVGGIALLYIIPVIVYNMNVQNVSNNTIIMNWVISGIGLFAGLCGIYTSMVEISADMANGFDLFFL